MNTHLYKNNKKFSKVKIIGLIPPKKETTYLEQIGGNSVKFNGRITSGRIKISAEKMLSTEGKYQIKIKDKYFELEFDITSSNFNSKGFSFIGEGFIF